MPGQVVRRIGTAVAEFDSHVPPPGQRLGQGGDCGGDAGRRMIEPLFWAGQKAMPSATRLVPFGEDLRRSGSIAQLYGGKQAIIERVARAYTKVC